METLVGKVITIDGPSASGKTSVSREVARRLNCEWFSTGAIYRGLAFVIREKSISETDESTILPLCDSPEWHVKLSTLATEVYYKGQNVTREIHHEDIGSLASKISTLPKVRAALIAGQRKFKQTTDILVAEGRDCGTVIFPEAELKVYLTADLNKRVARRVSEVNSINPAAGLDQATATQNQAERDARDSQRAVAPLKVADGALVIDATDLTLDQVCDQILIHAQGLV